MKGPPQTIDLSNDKEEGIGQTYLQLFLRIFSWGAEWSEPATAIQSDQLVKSVIDELFCKMHLGEKMWCVS